MGRTLSGGSDHRILVCAWLPGSFSKLICIPNPTYSADTSNASTKDRTSSLQRQRNSTMTGSSRTTGLRQRPLGLERMRPSRRNARKINPEHQVSDASGSRENENREALRIELQSGVHKQSNGKAGKMNSRAWNPNSAKHPPARIESAIKGSPLPSFGSVIPIHPADARASSTATRLT